MGSSIWARDLLVTHTMGMPACSKARQNSSNPGAIRPRIGSRESMAQKTTVDVWRKPGSESQGAILTENGRGSLTIGSTAGVGSFKRLSRRSSKEKGGQSLCPPRSTRLSQGESYVRLVARGGGG